MVLTSKTLISLLLCCFCLSACSSLTRNSGQPSTLAKIPLLNPAALGHHWQLSQTVTLHFDSPTNKPEVKPMSMLAAWTISDKRMDFVALTPAGQTIMQLAYDGEHFSEEYSPIMPAAVPGWDIIAQLQLAYWPLDAIKARFQNSAWRIEAPAKATPDSQQRNLYFGSQKVLNINRTELGPSSATTSIVETIEINHYLMRYRVRINTLTKTDHPPLPILK